MTNKDINYAFAVSNYKRFNLIIAYKSTMSTYYSKTAEISVLNTKTLVPV
jgi:hypothetical protein